MGHDTLAWRIWLEWTSATFVALKFRFAGCPLIENSQLGFARKVINPVYPTGQTDCWMNGWPMEERLISHMSCFGFLIVYSHNLDRPVQKTNCPLCLYGCRVKFISFSSRYDDRILLPSLGSRLKNPKESKTDCHFLDKPELQVLEHLCPRIRTYVSLNNMCWIFTLELWNL